MDEGMIYNQPKAGVAHKGAASDMLLEGNRGSDDLNQSMLRLESELNVNKRKKYLVYGAIGLIALVLIIVFAVLGGKGKKPDPPKPPPVTHPRIFNPYVLYEAPPNKYPSYNMRSYLISRNKTLGSEVGNFTVPFFTNNYTDSPLIDMAELRASVVNNYNTLRLEILDTT